MVVVSNLTVRLALFSVGYIQCLEEAGQLGFFVTRQLGFN